MAEDKVDLDKLFKAIDKVKRSRITVEDIAKYIGIKMPSEMKPSGLHKSLTDEPIKTTDEE